MCGDAWTLSGKLIEWGRLKLTQPTPLCTLHYNVPYPRILSLASPTSAEGRIRPTPGPSATLTVLQHLVTFLVRPGVQGPRACQQFRSRRSQERRGTSTESVDGTRRAAASMASAPIQGTPELPPECHSHLERGLGSESHVCSRHQSTLVYLAGGRFIIPLRHTFCGPFLPSNFFFPLDCVQKLCLRL